MMTTRFRRRRYMRGVSLVELMIGITLGLLLLIGLSSLYLSNSLARTEFNKSAEQIENGRYALDLLARDLELAGFMGAHHLAKSAAPSLPTICEGDVTDLGFALSPALTIPVAVTVYRPGVTPPACLPNYRANTEVVAIRRVATNAVAPATLVAGTTYLQASACSADSAPFTFGSDPALFTLRNRTCDSGAIAPIWRYVVRLYYLADCDRCTTPADGIPTLKMAELGPTGLTVTSVTQGIESLHVELGLDLDQDGSPDCYVDDANLDHSATCTAVPGYDWTLPARNWQAVATVRANVLARTTAPSPGWRDTRVYALGGVSMGPFDDQYKRRVYAQAARLWNATGVVN
jgi:type IV pilus assembly protein PilW